jgi:hypothetical protein
LGISGDEGDTQVWMGLLFAPKEIGNRGKDKAQIKDESVTILGPLPFFFNL